MTLQKTFLNDTATKASAPSNTHILPDELAVCAFEELKRTISEEIFEGTMAQEPDNEAKRLTQKADLFTLDNLIEDFSQTEQTYATLSKIIAANDMFKILRFDERYTSTSQMVSIASEHLKDRSLQANISLSNLKSAQIQRQPA